MKRRLRKTRAPRIGSRGPARSDRGGCVSRGGRQAERRGNAPKRFRQALQRFLHDGRRCRQPCCVSLFERDRLDRYRTGVRFATSDTGPPKRMTRRRAAPAKSVKARSTGPLCRQLRALRLNLSRGILGPEWHSRSRRRQSRYEDSAQQAGRQQRQRRFVITEGTARDDELE